ncbi:hypothetical protein P8452_62747 [Trifolium repens]|nr:hypothetical protein P8452_62747 [Trifolium repens]
MEHQESSVEKFEKFTLKIENLSRLDKAILSEPFVLGGFPWMIYLCTGGNMTGDYLSIYLYAVQTANMSEGWSRDVKLKFRVFSVVNTNMTITKRSAYKFNERENFLAFESFMTLAELRDPNKGFLEKNAFFVGVEVYVFKSRNEKRVNQAANLTASLKPKLEKGEVQIVGELMDFKGLGLIEKAFVPLLNQVCSLHPLLIKCQQKRSRQFREWAFTALGRVLYFLKTRKARDMNDLACKDLQILWEEVEPFSFDLRWLEPHVKSALGLKGYLERLNEAEKLKDNVVALELEMLRLKANLDSAKYLLEAQDFQEINLDAELL